MNSSPIDSSHEKLLLDYQLPSQLTAIPKLAEAVETALSDKFDLVFAANLCLDELITNTIQHGLKGAPNRFINIRISILDEWLEIRLRDDAPKFDPFTEVTEPDLNLDIEDRPLGGLGVHIVKNMMDKVYTCYDGNGNLTVLLKSLKKRD